MTFPGARATAIRRSLAIVALGAVSAVLPAWAQRVTVANTDAVRLVVVPFARREADSALSNAVANGIRDRLTVAYASRFNVVAKRVIDTNLVLAGFVPDAPLDPAMSRQLARVLNARLLVEGMVLPATDDSVEVIARISEIVGALPQTASAAVRVERRRANNRTGSELANQLADVYRSFDDTRECDARRRAREFPRALDRARAALERNPNSSQAYLCMAQVLQEQQASPDTVIRLLERAGDADSLNAQAQWQLARAYEERHDTTGLIRALRRFLLTDPNNHQVRISVAQLLTNREFIDSAVAILDSSLTRNPNVVDLVLARSVVLSAGRRWAEAGADLARVAQLDSSKVDSAFVVRVIGTFDQAADTAGLIRWVRVGTQRFPQTAAYWYQLAVLVRAQSDTAGAIEAIREYVRLVPTSAPGHLVYAAYLLDVAEYDSAAAHATQAGELAGEDNPQVRASAAQVLFAVGARRLQAQDFPGSADLLGRAKSWAAASSAFRIAYYLGIAQLQMAVAADAEAQAASARDQTTARCDAARRELELLTLAEQNVTEGGRADPDRAMQLLQETVPAYRQRAQVFQRQARCPSE